MIKYLPTYFVCYHNLSCRFLTIDVRCPVIITRICYYSVMYSMPVLGLIDLIDVLDVNPSAPWFYGGVKLVCIISEILY